MIGPYRGWFDWRLRQLWRYRDLVTLLVWRDFVSIYKQTILGPGWHIVQTLLTTLTFTVIFAKIAGLPTDGAPPSSSTWLEPSCGATSPTLSTAYPEPSSPTPACSER